MTVSGTTIFNLSFVEAIEEAYDRASADGPRSGYEMKSARRSINLMFADWANRGVNLFTIEERSIALTQDEGEYDLTPTTSDVVDVIEQVVQLVGSDPIVRYNVTRVSISTQATRTNPNLTGRPTEVWYDRRTSGVTAHVWPLPPSDGLYVLYYTVLRRMDDAGAYTNTADMPFRFLPAFISGLAFMVAAKKQPDNINLLSRLKQEYAEDWERASTEDREKATLSIVPRSSSYRVRQ